MFSQYDVFFLSVKTVSRRVPLLPFQRNKQLTAWFLQEIKKWVEGKGNWPEILDFRILEANLSST